jgi:phosphoglycerate dehydrogenase-like enzyme
MSSPSVFQRPEALHVVVRLEAGLTPEQQDRIRAASPQAEVVFVRGEEDLAAALPDAEVVGGGVPPRLFPLARRLRCVYNFGAGADGMLYPEIRSSDVVLTTSKGAHAAPISEHCLTFMLMFAHRFPMFAERQRAARWEKERPFIDELLGKTVGVVGLGNIGRELARKCKVGFGMRVVGTSRSLRPVEHVDRLYGPGELHQLLGESDFVCITLPGTPQTRGLLGEAELRAMKRTAYLINVGRGQHVVTAALVRALERGWIAGAGLDAMDPEPLPPDHPLWKMPNVVISPHIAGLTRGTRDRGTARFCENLRRLLRGEPLEGLVDREAGY